MAGQSYDNALAEATHGLYKAELINRQQPPNLTEAINAAVHLGPGDGGESTT